MVKWQVTQQQLNASQPKNSHFNGHSSFTRSTGWAQTHLGKIKAAKSDLFLEWRAASGPEPLSPLPEGHLRRVPPTNPAYLRPWTLKPTPPNFVVFSWDATRKPHTCSRVKFLLDSPHSHWFSSSSSALRPDNPCTLRSSAGACAFFTAASPTLVIKKAVRPRKTLLGLH